MPIYIQKYPEQIEAIQFTGNNFNDCEKFCEGITFVTNSPKFNYNTVALLPNNKLRVNIGDYIERFEHLGNMEYTVSDERDFEEYYKLLS